MSERFADSFFFFALLDKGDEAHDKATEAVGELHHDLVTTPWVLLEVGDGLAAPRTRRRFVALLEFIRAREDFHVVRVDQATYDRAVELYSQRADKEWTLTDCTSFVVMRERGIRDALTGDHHFEQAGFTALLK
ncbi:MAG: type II toxin-antitoxin system VapC family toxin [Planctomycetes bacterium]|nr:type II toxin-antitoxin system VapC family toxin [Planctomycetota bacterium]